MQLTTTREPIDKPLHPAPTLVKDTRRQSVTAASCLLGSCSGFMSNVSEAMLDIPVVM